MTDCRRDDIPRVQLKSLDELWFQVAGTRCNLECTHCFISCSPRNHRFGFLDLATVRRILQETKESGIREYYFTGGEPFLNPDMTDILCETLDFGPASVLTNGTVLKPEWLDRLRQKLETTCYGVEFRVSIDGPNADWNDPVRGEGTFERAIRGVGLLVKFGFLPIITMTRIWEIEKEPEILEQFRRVLAEHGVLQSRLKVLPRLQIGAEIDRTGGYVPGDLVTNEMLEDFDLDQLVCHHSRIVSDRGVHVCPILLDEPGSIIGTSLLDADQDFALTHEACLTCYQYGAICMNPGGTAGE